MNRSKNQGMKKTLLYYLVCFVFVGLLSACKKSTNNPPIPEPKPVDTIKTTPKIGDPDYFLYGDVKEYEGIFYVTDSVLASGSTLGDPNAVWEYDTTVATSRHYWVKKDEDTLHISFTLTCVLGTYFALKPDILNVDGWYIVNEFNHFKFSNDSLLVNGDYIVPPYVFGYPIKRAARYVGILE